jgi:hypothetical protein
MKHLLVSEQAASVHKYNDVVNDLKTIHIDKAEVLHFRASCLHTTNVAQIQKSHLFVQVNKISSQPQRFLAFGFFGDVYFGQG